MMKEYQITLFCTTGEYKPVSCIIKRDDEELERVGRDNFIKALKLEGIKKICQKRYWGNSELKKYNYTKVKIREYNKEKIQKENAERYEAIKKERGWVTK